MSRNRERLRVNPVTKANKEDIKMFKYNTKEAFKNAIHKANIAKTKMQLLALMTASVAASPITVLAGTGGTDPTATVETVLDYVTLVFPLIGAPLVLVGAFKLFMAYRNNQPEEYSSAAKDVAIGAVMIVFRAFVWTGLKSVIF